MDRKQNISRLVDLTHPEKNVIFNMTHAEAVEIVKEGDPSRIREIDGQFALVSLEGASVHLARSIGRPLRYFIAKLKDGPCLVVAPQVLRESPRSDERGTWIAEDLEVFLRHLRKTHPEIDADRIYLTGNSMGGYGSWTWGGHHPEHFAAIAPIVGGIGRGGPKDVTPDLEKWAANLAKVPVFAFAGAQDKVVPAERSKRMVTAIREAGGTRAKIRIYPDEGHGAGRVAFSTPEFFDWMFAQKRGAADSKTEGPKSE